MQDPKRETIHDRGWAPWRFAVLLVPIYLFLLLPPESTLENEAPFELTPGALGALDAAGLPASVLAKLQAMVSRKFKDEGAFLAELATCLDLDELREWRLIILKHAEARYLDFGYVENSARDPKVRNDLKGTQAHLKGVLYPKGDGFALLSQRFSCTAADAIPVGIVLIIPDNFDRNALKDLSFEWVDIRGIIGYLDPKKNGSYVTTLAVERIEKTKAIPRK